MATTLSNPSQRLLIAITDDDPKCMERLNFTPEEIINFRMEGEMNILNFAIDNERIEIIKFLASIGKKLPRFAEILLNYRFGKD